ncbi:MAG TPA: phytoene desaturase family protein [Wenzhouxiangella sp.]
MSHLVVIGGGFGGIAAALRARAKGYQVTLIDRCPRLGGRAQVFERAGYRHDAGPTVITAPFLFEELFELFDRKLSDYITLVPLKPWYRFRFNDGEHFDYGGSMEDTLSEIKRLSPPDVENYQKLLQDSKKLYDVGFTQLSDAPFHSFWFMLKQVPHLIRLGAWRTVWQMITRRIESDYLRQAFSIQPLLVGGNPFDTTSIYGLIHFLEQAHGVHFAMGGTGALVDGLQKLMREVGIEIQLETTVESLEVRGDKITRIKTYDEQHQRKEIACDAVISNADPAHLYGELLPSQAVKTSAQIKVRHAKKSMGLFVLFFGTRRQYPDIAHHTIWMGPRYRDLLKDIFQKKILADDFSIYLHRPTATDPSFAPEGCDSFYALVPVPNLQAQIDWDIEGPKLSQRVIQALEETMMPELSDHLEADFYMTPEDFEERYLSPEGAGFSIAPYFSQSAWFRFHNQSEGPSNLYLVGAGTHPGAGMPGVLCSAKVIDRLLEPVA